MKEDFLSTEPYKGVRDFYPADWARLSAVFGVLRGVLSKWGYEEYNASPLERTELYESKGNEEIIQEQTYTFDDRGGRKVTLRPEMTPTLARMIAARRRDMPLPARWFSIGNRFRYERPQKGRLREFYQADIDLVGLPEGEADLELLTLAPELLRAFGATADDFIVRINSRALLTAACELAGLKGESVRVYLRLLDKKAKMPESEFKAAQEAIVPIDPLTLIENNDPRILPEKEKLMNTIATLKKRGVMNAMFDPTLTRGFDYYTGIVFEIFDTNPENPRALFGGGRYDNLLTLFGSDSVPAVGFALGDVALMDFLVTHDLVPESQDATELYLGTPSENDFETARSFAESLRGTGLRIFVNLTGKSLSEQIRDASRRAIPYFAAAGENERASRTLKVKNLASGEERTLALADVVDFIRV